MNSAASTPAADTPGEGTTASSPDVAALRPAGETFSFSSPLNSTEWTATIAGLVELGTSGDSEPAPCLAVLTTLTGTATESSAPMKASAPPIFLQTDAGIQGRGGANCDFDDLEAAGYEHIDSATFTLGEAASVFYPIVNRTEAEVEAIGVGNPSAPESTWQLFASPVLTVIPEAAS